MTEIPETNGEKLERNPDGTIKSGVLNPNGRPVGTYSLKTKIINFLKENPEAEKKLMAELLAKEQGLLLQMIDGRPHQATDVTSGGEKILVMSPELIEKNETH